MSVALGLADIKDVTEKPTHIVIYRGSSSEITYSSDAILKVLEEVRADCRRVQESLDKMRVEMEAMRLVARVEKVLEDTPRRSTPFLSSSLAPEPVGLSVIRNLNSEFVTPTHAGEVKTVLSSLIDHHSTEKKFEESEDTEEVQEEAEESEADAEEEDDEAMELEEFTYNDETYYRDAEGNVYQKDDDGDLDDTPIGTWDEENERIVVDYSKLGYTEFTYKGNIYYRDEDNLVYQKDEDGDLVDEAIGVWNEEKQKVLKYAKAA
jgi:hypothetical protein